MLEFFKTASCLSGKEPIALQIDVEFAKIVNIGDKLDFSQHQFEDMIPFWFKSYDDEETKEYVTGHYLKVTGKLFGKDWICLSVKRC